MKSRIGYNIHKFTPGLMEHLERIQPVWLLFLDDHGGAALARRSLPNTNVITRIYTGDEEGMHLTPGKTLAYLVERVRELQRDPALAQIGIRFGDLWINLGNEPGPSNNDPSFVDQMKRCVDEQLQALRWAEAEGAKVVFVNLGSGKMDDEHWPLIDPLINEVVKRPTQFAFGVHEYGAGHLWSGVQSPRAELFANEIDHIPPVSWKAHPQGIYYHVGRFTRYFAYRRASGLKLPRTIITEHGVDNMDDVGAWLKHLIVTPGYHSVRGWKTLVNQWASWYSMHGWSPEQAYFEMLKAADREIYQPTWNTATLEGVEGQTVYCWGYVDQQWEQFDVAQAFHFHRLNEAYAKEGKPVAQIIERKPYPANSGTPTEAVLKANGSVNLRIAPDTRAPMVPGVSLGVPDGARVQWYPGVKDTGSGYEWTRVRYKLDESLWADGWMARVWPAWAEQFAAPPREWPRPILHMPVQHVTQKGTGLNNCGPAALASVVRFWAAKTGQQEWLKTISVVRIAGDMNKGSAYASVQQLEAGGTRYGLPLYSKSDISYDALIGELSLGRPVIALIERGKLRPEFGNFDGSHFVALIGYGEGYVILHDPLGDAGGNGDAWKVSREDFIEAWETTPGNGRRRVALFIPQPAMQPVEPPTPDAAHLLHQAQALINQALAILNQ